MRKLLTGAAVAGLTPWLIAAAWNLHDHHPRPLRPRDRRHQP